MNFTREPIIESVITSSDGYKLRLTKLNKKEGRDEDFQVNALEIVTFGASCFYRHREKPKSFLIPVAEYELTQVRDTRLTLKYATVDKSIKIIPEKVIKKTESKGAKSTGKDEGKSKDEVKKSPKKSSRPKLEGRKKDVPIDMSVIKVLAPPTGLISDSLKKYKSIDFSDKDSLSLLPAPTKLVDTPIVAQQPAPAKENKSEDKVQKVVEVKPQEPKPEKK
jgi:hypothetical protein